MVENIIYNKALCEGAEILREKIMTYMFFVKRGNDMYMGYDPLLSNNNRLVIC